MGAPSLTGAFAPGMQFWWGVGRAGVNAVRSTGIAGEANKPTDIELRETLKGLAPRFSPITELGWGGLEERFQTPGAPYQEASGKGGPVRRDEKDWMARKLGTYTLKEAKEKTQWYAAQRKQAKLTKHVDRAVDLLLKPTVDQKALQRLWTDLGEKQFTSQEITQALRREIQMRMVEADVRGVRGAQTPKQQRLYLLFQQLGGYEGENVSR